MSDHYHHSPFPLPNESLKQTTFQPIMCLLALERYSGFMFESHLKIRKNDIWLKQSGANRVEGSVIFVLPSTYIKIHVYDQMETEHMFKSLQASSQDFYEEN